MIGRKTIAAAAMVAALGGGAAVGAIAGAPSLSAAQEETTTVDPGTVAPAPPGPRDLGIRGMKWDAAAEAIGISEDDLRAALKDGQTLAEIAAANDVDRQVVVDALVAAGEAQLDELRETLPERMDELMDFEPGSHRHGEHPRGGWGDRSGD